eukprot:TRINITY_DN418_c0_g1_i2.p3 TRINITY_DN418_c0_g1~~TRINITY_DN418_c0_g1_i2.p3  ORF type:complete len:172 (+),score=23.84 TRINITY_DN418_c0_g1_i2:705-1220(+)
MASKADPKATIPQGKTQPQATQPQPASGTQKQPSQPPSGNQVTSPAPASGKQVPSARNDRDDDDDDRGDREPQSDKRLGKFQSVPLREYYDQTVTKILLEGLKEIGKQRPDNPVRFLGQYLLEHDPQGRQRILLVFLFFEFRKSLAVSSLQSFMCEGLLFHFWCYVDSLCL